MRLLFQKVRYKASLPPTERQCLWFFGEAERKNGTNHWQSASQNPAQMQQNKQLLNHIIKKKIHLKTDGKTHEKELVTVTKYF